MNGHPVRNSLVSEKNTFAKPVQHRVLLKYPDRMAIENILAQIDSEIERLKQARSLLANIGTAARHDGHTFKRAAATAKPRKKRVLSAEARKRIADAQRKRWAAQRAKTKAKAKA